jgi:hypothetical protein
VGKAVRRPEGMEKGRSVGKSRFEKSKPLATPEGVGVGRLLGGPLGVGTLLGGPWGGRPS